jgi:hypothetical protein
MLSIYWRVLWSMPCKAGKISSFARPFPFKMVIGLKMKCPRIHVYIYIFHCFCAQMMPLKCCYVLQKILHFVFCVVRFLFYKYQIETSL